MAALSFTITRNDISPALTRLIVVARNKAPVLRAMGNTFKSITEGNFKGGTQYRPGIWKSKRDGSVATLMKTNTLSRSFHLGYTESTVSLANPMIYAATHQFGATIRPRDKKALKFQVNGHWFTVKQVVIPPRPFYPVADGKLTPAAERLIARAGERVIAKQTGATLT